MSAADRFLELGLELDERAKRFEDLHVGPTQADDEGIITRPRFIELLEGGTFDAAVLKSRPSLRWVFWPLIRDLIENRGALWVCLGNFVSARDGQVQRRWCYFTPPGLDEGSDTFKRFHRVVSFNARFGDLATEAYLLTTAFLDKSKCGYPMVVNLAGPHFDPVPRLVTLDWGDLHAEVAAEHSYHHLDQIPDDGGARAARSGGVLPFLWRTPQNSIALPDGAQRYGDALKAFGQDREHQQRLEQSFAELPPENPKLLEVAKASVGKLASYAAFLVHMREEAAQLITVPAWLPATGKYGRSGALLACFDRRHLLDTRDVLALFTAFRLGCQVVAADAAEELGRERSARNLAHDIKAVTRIFQKNWIVAPEKLFDVEIQPTGPDETKLGTLLVRPEASFLLSERSLGVTVFREYLEHTGRLISFWCWRDDPSDLPFDERPTTLVGLVGAAWSACVNAVPAGQYFTESPNTLAGVLAIRAKIADLVAHLTGRLVVKAPDSFPVIDWASTKTQSFALTRLLVALLANAVEHAAADAPVEIVVSSLDAKPGRWQLVLRDRRAKTPNPWSRGARVLASVRDGITSSKDTVSACLRSLGSSLGERAWEDAVGGVDGNGQYSLSVTFAFP